MSSKRIDKAAAVLAMKRLMNAVFAGTPVGSNLDVIAEATPTGSRIRFELTRNGVTVREFKPPTVLRGGEEVVDRVGRAVAAVLTAKLEAGEKANRGKRE